MLFTCADPVCFACGPPPDYDPASQWSVVVVSFHWCVGSNSVATPFWPRSLKTNKYVAH